MLIEKKMEIIKKIPSDCGQFILPVKTLQKMTDKEYTLLDVGGGEHLLKRFLPSNIKYFSLDYAGNQDFIQNLDILPIEVNDNSFDIIVCLETLEHTMYPHRVMKEILRIAKPNALFILSLPNEYNFYCRLNFLFGKKTLVQESFYVVEHHHHIQLPRKKDIITFFSEYIKIEEVDYRWYSRHSKNKIVYIVDRLINIITPFMPSLFTRTVVVKGRRK